MKKHYLAGGLIAALAFAIGVAFSGPDHIAPNAIFHLPSDTGEYVLVLETELVVTTDAGHRLVRYQKEDVLPSLEDLLRGESLVYDDVRGYPHRFDGGAARRKLQDGLRKALFGM